MAEPARERRRHETDREALAEATAETLEVYANLAEGYAGTIARQSELLASVDATLRKVRQILAET